MGSLTEAVAPVGVGRRTAPGRTRPQREGAAEAVRVLRTNVFTFFNNILFVIGTALLLLGRPGDAVISVGIGLLNALISSGQEFLSRRRLARLRAAQTGDVAVRRGDAELRLPPAEVVVGDLVPLSPADLIVVDGPLERGRVEVDESLVTGEAVPVVRAPGERLLAGSTVLGGSGEQRAEAVGPDSYAGMVAGAAARAARAARTPLQRRVDFLIRLVLLTVGVMSGAILGQAALDGQTLTRFVQTAAVLSGLVPYGLFLLITVAYSGAAATIGRAGVLVARVGAVESMSNVDVLCTDKTGTLTGELRLAALDPAPGVDRAAVESALAGLAAAAAAPTPVITALAAALPGVAPTVLDQVPFSADLRWRGLVTADGALVLGAPDVLAAAVSGPDRTGVDGQVAARIAEGRRVLVLARGTAPGAGLRDAGGHPTLPALTRLAVVALEEELRPGVAETVAGLQAQGVTLKVLSGDDPRTVAAVAAAAGISSADPVSGAELDALAPEVFARVVAQRSVFGRLTPDHKARVVASLRRGGAHVAMIGNGLNDAGALREADVAVAMGGGSPVTRDVADIVLADDSFAPLLPAQAQGRRVIGGIVTSMHLFLARVATATLIIAVVSMLGLGFPYQPAQVGLTLFTVGLPSFFLTLWAAPQRVEERMLAGLARFVLPAALVTGVFAVGIYTYLYTRVLAAAQSGRLPAGAVANFAAYTDVPPADPGFPVAAATLGAQTGMSIFVSVSGVLLILFLCPPGRLFAAWAPATGDRRPALLVIGLLAALVVVLATPLLAEYFRLTHPAAPVVTAVAWAIVGWLVTQWAAFRWNVLDRVLGLDRAGAPD